MDETPSPALPDAASPDLAARAPGAGTASPPPPPDKEVAELYAWLNEMREAGPVAFDERIGAWQVFGYAEAQRILADPSFSSDLRAVGQAAGFGGERPAVIDRLTRASFFSMDEATHKKYRGLVNQAFSRRLVNRLQERISEVATGLLDELHGAPRFDLLEKLAYPLPMVVLCELLGVPPGDRRAFQGWASVLTTGPGGRSGAEGASPDQLAPELEELEGYLHELVRTRRLDPGADLLSRLLCAEVDGERLTDEDVVSLAAVMLLAGHNTTTMLLGNLVVCLDEHPDAAAALRADRRLLPAAVEECLRYRAPLPRFLRLTTRESRIGEHTVPAGRPVVVWTASANWDGEQFAAPERFDIHRSPNRHLSFGHGMHFCLGAPLARVVAIVAVSLLMDRCADIRVSRDVPLEYRAPRVNLAAERVPLDIRWAP